MTTGDTYRAFLEAKVCLAKASGAALSDAEVNPLLKQHQRTIVRWMVEGARRACFAAFGLGKSMIQLEAVRLARTRTGGRGLLVIPLGVRPDILHDAALLNRHAVDDAQRFSLTFIRRTDEAIDAEAIYLTNYESVRDGKVDPRAFKVVSLDEAAILRGFGGTKTFREFMATMAGDDRRDLSNRIRGDGIEYRFVATATPSPNEYIELLAYAAFLDVMDVGQAKTRFFKRNSEKADKLTLHPHKEREFWLWVASWALFVQKPSDIDPSFSDEGYILPPIDVRWQEVPSDHRAAGYERDGQGRMLRNASVSVQDAAREKRESLPARIDKMLALRAEDPGAHRLIWHDLEDERRAIERVLPSARYCKWLEFKDGNARALELYERHYSAYHYADGRERVLFAGPGEKTVLLTEAYDALFVWRKFIDNSGQQGVNCAVFRNEGPLLSSDLIKEAMAIGWSRWPGARFYTYVDREQIASPNPGFCFQSAGWTRCGETKGGLLIFEALPASVDAIEKKRCAVAVYGTQDLDEREASVIAFSNGEIAELAGKPVMLGAGCNFQRHCAWAIFLGIGFKFADFIQAVHRIHRFLQTRGVRIDLIYTEAEREVRKQLMRKWDQHNIMVEKMSEIIREYGLAQSASIGALVRSIGCARIEARGANYIMINNDCVQELQRGPTPDWEMEHRDASVDLIVTSIPFATQYEYSPSYNDFGHTDTNAHFWQQMDFLMPQLLRVLKPGRVAAVHVKDRICPGGVSGFGFQTVQPFSDECVAHFQKHGFAFLARKTIVTDVVRENAQTHRLGWSEQCKDGSRMGAGMPEYLLIFRKPPTDRSNGYADDPVVKDKAEYTRPRWQFDAHGFARSDGNRFLMPEELEGLSKAQIFRLFRKHSLENVYNFEHDVRIAENVQSAGMLPSTFMLLQPQSWHPDVWTDITRMRTLNSSQAQRGAEQHLCPLQFDIVDRAIEQYTMPGETVFDPFAGIGTVPYCAVKLGRHGIGIELNGRYFLDAAAYCAAAERKAGMPDMLDAFVENVDADLDEVA